MGIFAMSSSSPRVEKQGRGWRTPAALGPRPGGTAAAGEEGEWRRAAWGLIPSLDLRDGGT